MFNVVVSAILAYAITSGYIGNRLLSLYEILNTKNMLLFLVMTFAIILMLLILLDHWKENRRMIKAALTARRHPKLRKHVMDGVTEGCFAYLISPHKYGTEATLPPMSIVYIIGIVDRGVDRIAHVVPRFESHVELPDEFGSVPQMSIEVKIDQLWKYVPRHMIPELV